MKKTLLLPIFILILQFAYSQGSNWKQLPVPFKSHVRILKQTSNGSLFGRTSNNIGYVVSHDDGLTWSYLPINIDLGYYNNFIGEDHKGRILFLSYFNVYRFDLNTFEIDTFPTKNIYSLKSIASFDDNFIIAQDDQQIFTIYKDGSILIKAIKYLYTHLWANWLRLII